MIKKSLEQMIEEILKPYFAIEVSRCKDCGHSENNHYWNGGGNPANAGYDRCKAKDCECISENFETEICDYGMIPTDDLLSLFTQLVQECVGKDEKLELIEKTEDYDVYDGDARSVKERNQIRAEILTAFRQRGIKI